MRRVIADIITSLKPEKEKEDVTEGKGILRIDIQVWPLQRTNVENLGRLKKKSRPSKVNPKWKMTTKVEEEWVTRHFYVA